jgi:cell division septal protein FtsQ
MMTDKELRKERHEAYLLILFIGIAAFFMLSGLVYWVEKLNSWGIKQNKRSIIVNGMGVPFTDTAVWIVVKTDKDTSFIYINDNLKLKHWK